MTLLWCIFAIIVAMGISRYNQSNKLFWVLVISFLAGIAGVAVFGKMSSKGLHVKKDKLVQVCPTQGVSDVSDYINPLAGTDQILTECYKPNLVSKDYIPATNEQSMLNKCAIPTVSPPPKTKLPCLPILIPHDG